MLGEQVSEAPQLTFHMIIPVTLRSQADTSYKPSTSYELPWKDLRSISTEMHIPSSGILNVAESL